MGKNYILFLLVTLLFAFQRKEKSTDFTGVEIEEVYTDSLSIRAIELTNNKLFFAANKGIYGFVDLANDEVTTNVQKYENSLPEFRSVGHTSNNLFMMSIANPALLYKIDKSGKPMLVYEEHDTIVFYDAMRFWNEMEGIAIGDHMNGCLSIIISRDGGHSWNKVSCSDLPDSAEGEGAFAASNTNISLIHDHTWIATTSGRIYYSPNKGINWEVFLTPIVNEKSTQGIYSIDFYNEKIGIAIGGDYTSPEDQHANKAITLDGGRNWQLIADNMEPNYKSCVQFVPNSGGRGLVAVGFTGISYSGDQGRSWKQLSEESLYTIRFVNDTLAYAAGRGRILKLRFY